jgi:signal transduction histidine kinase
MKNLLRSPWSSLHARLLIGAALWIIIALTLSDIAISALFRQHVTGQFVHELTDHLQELQAVTHFDERGQVVLSRTLSDPRFEVPGSGFYWQVSGAAGPLLRSPSLQADAIRQQAGQAPIDPYTTRLSPSGAEILVTEWDVPTPGHPLRFSVGADLSQLHTVLDRFSQLLRTSLALIGGGLISAAIAQVALGLRPMARLRRTLAAVRTGEAEVLPEDFPNEVQPLVTELNSLIAANHERVRRARAQAGNLAHALKGPLAILADEAHRLEQSGNPAAAETVLNQCRTMSRQIDYQIARARAAATRAGSGLRSGPPEVAGMVITAMARLYGDQNLTFENALNPDLEVACDREDLSEMMGNLIDNAAKWARRQVRISDVATAGGGGVWIVIDDDGPGIDAEKRMTVFGIGARLDEQKPGSGLGLAIVKDLAELYGGQVSLSESELGGLRAAIELPRAANSLP